MKKITFAATFILGCMSITPAFSQLGDQRNNLSIGANAGINFSSVSFSPTIKQKDLNGMSFGLTARYMSEKYFKMMCGIQAEINYSQRGWEEDIDDGSGNTFSKRLNYIEIPLLTHLAFGKDAIDRGTKFFINLGPSVGYFLSESETRGGGEWDTTNRTNGVVEQYGKNTENKFDYGILGGLGLEVSTKAGHFLLEGRYYYGLSDIYKNTKKDPFDRSANQYLAVRMTYLFDITK